MACLATGCVRLQCRSRARALPRVVGDAAQVWGVKHGLFSREGPAPLQETTQISYTRSRTLPHTHTAPSRTPTRTPDASPLPYSPRLL
eukprot:scaffold117303_cov66-Phaeocystis_antarctica.AAC.1